MAVERCVRLMNSPKYVFDEAEAEWALELISKFKHTKGDYKGVSFQLMDWQKFFVAYIYGLRHRHSGLRVTRKVLLCIAKKGGKSELGGAIGLIEAFFNGEQAAECYTVANKRDQAKFSFDSAKVMTKYFQDEGYLDDVRIYDSQQSYSLVSKIDGGDRDPDGSFFTAIASDSGTLDGVFPQFGLVDEYHESRDTSIPDNLESGMVSRSQPLLMIITTRGFNILGPLWELEQRYEDLLTGAEENDEVFPLIFAMDEGDDWEDEEKWEKANPGIGQTPTWDGLRSEYRKAKTEGATRLTSFRTKNLNEWAKTSTTWIKREDYLRASTDFKEEMLLGRTCYAGLDLATVRDLTAWVLLFPPTDDDPKFYCLARFFAPEDNARERAMRDKVPYLDWQQRGWLTLTPGNVTDYDYVESVIKTDAQKFDIVQANYDRFNSSDMVTRLVADGIPLESFNQGFINFNAPICALEKMILEGLFDHQNNPVLAWCFQNAVLKHNAGGNVIFDKGKSRERIDGAVGVAMAKAAWLDHKEKEPEITGDIMTW